MKICLISAFPPSRRLLNEYGYHIADELQRHSLLSVTVLGDVMETATPELDGFDVVRCWELNKTINHRRIFKALRDIKPDVVWFNLVFSSFGNANNPLAAFSGLTLPAATRMAGYYTHVTLHHLMDHVDLKDSGIKHARLYRAAGYFATRAVLMANSVSVLLPAYRRTLMQKYHGENVHFRAHGILSSRPEFPDLSLRGNPEHHILVFGKWGTYKRLELLLQAFESISARMPNIKLVIAGGNHPMAPGYVESVRERFGGNPKIEFTGYVEEEDIAPLFRTASVLVMPYSSATGASGVAHLGCEYGVPIISADIPDFRGMAEDEGLAIEFYRTGNAEDMATKIMDLLRSPDRQREMAERNFSAALRMTMPQIIQQYVRTFNLHQRARAMQPIARYRRIPGWVPSRSMLFRAAAQRWSAWM
ncbi:MAG TPA: glycosyltransferase [Terriglobales bacterium]|nr:glycosyltransferase [Terriglobales bacterium]